MKKLRSTICVPAMVGLLVVGVPGCSKKSVQSGGDTQASQHVLVKGKDSSGGMSASSSQGSNKVMASPNFPETSLSTRDTAADDLQGLNKNPSEERVGPGVLMAKADPGNPGRQVEEIRAEQTASAMAGLRDVFFAYDSFAISDEGRQALARNVEWIRANPGAQVKIEGHCDERGTSAYNLVLGEKRAKAVRNFLVELGVAVNRLAIVSYGKERPFCREHAEACYAQNRRGHVVVRADK